MSKLIWIGLVLALGACEKKKEPAKRAAARTSGSAAPAPAEPASSAAPAPEPAAPPAEEEDTRPVPSCAEALAKSLENLASADSPDAAELQSKLHAIYLRHCNEDKWPIAVLRCYASTTGMSAMKLCRGKLPPDQIAKLQAEVMGVMSGGAQPAARSSGPVPVGGPPAAPRN